MKDNADVLSKNAEDAIEWKTLLDSGDATDQDRRDLETWLRQCELNVLAWQRLHSRMAPLYGTLRVPTHRQLVENVPATASATRRNMLFLSVGLCIVSAGAEVVDRFVPLGNLTADKFTLTGESATLSLADGSVLMLGPRTAVNYNVSATTRSVSLISGELMIHISDDGRDPLVLTTSQMTAMSEGGRLVIRCRDDHQTLTSLDRATSVATPSGDTYRLEKEQSLVFADERYWTRRADISRETAWTEGLLIVRDHTLEDVISGIRPYFPGIVRVDPIAGQRRVTGVFPLTVPRETIAQIGRIMELDVRWRTPYWVSIGLPATSIESQDFGRRKDLV